MTPAAFRDLLVAAPNGLGSALSVELRARGLTVRTFDDHAAHAVELLATRRGLRVLVTRPDTGQFVLGLKGFTR